MISIDDQANVATANELYKKLRTTQDPLTDAERRALAELLAAISDRVNTHTQPHRFNPAIAWAGISSTFHVHMRALRTGGVL